MTDHEFSNEEMRDRLTRRQVLHGALAGGAMLSAGGLLAACGGSSGSSSGGGGGGTAKSSPPATGTIKAGGSLKVGATGGGCQGHHRRAPARPRTRTSCGAGTSTSLWRSARRASGPWR